MSFFIQTGSVHDFTNSRRTGWLQVFYPQPFNTLPVVFAQTQTFNGPDSPGIRIQNVTTDSFEVRMDELQASGATSSAIGRLGKFVSDGVHPNPETLGWVAIG